MQTIHTMIRLKQSRKLITGLVVSALLSGCASVDQYLGQGDTSAQATSLKIEQENQSLIKKQNQQIKQLAEQQTIILAELQKQPELFAQQKQNIEKLNNKLEDYIHLRKQQAINSQLIANKQAEKKVNLTANSKRPAATVASERTDVTTPIDKLVIGSEEFILLNDLEEQYKARIDTGATTSSLNATDIVEFERDGTRWVRFNFSHSVDDEAQMIEAKVARTILVRQANTKEQARRPIIELPVQLGNIKMLTEFTLSDRQHMTFPVLLGRTFLKDMVMVDVARTYTLTKTSS